MYRTMNTNQVFGLHTLRKQPAIEADDEFVLVRLFLSGDMTAFDRIYELYEEYVYHICLGILGNPDDSRDAMQETFVSIYNGLEKFRYKSKLSTWIYRTTVNRCLDIIRSNRHKNEECSVEWMGSTVAIEKEIVREQVIRSAMNKLKPHYRTMLVLHYFQGLTYEEIGEIMNWSIHNVRTTLHRARHSFKEAYTSQRCNDEMQ